MRTNPLTSCPIRTCTVTALRGAVATGEVEMAVATLDEFPEGRWVTITPLLAMPDEALLVVEITAETDSQLITAAVTASMEWLMSQPSLLAVHHHLGRLLADSVDLEHPALAPVDDVGDQTDTDPMEDVP